ncbi:Ig-specific serine endopeptidase MIP [Mycoplasmopsis pulmonis]|uniref:Ig-specific serine endopeptidase MIP n=1 Tax=Mycoplasmopsis pulmonis TaxID=2107 RepID=UPI002ACE9555|nr:DUF31 family protein [Mycoplasmopsis pulmonis]MDZ7293247.1 DUF31 family protein [Mycoplasmopsis pulmonis]
MKVKVTKLKNKKQIYKIFSSFALLAMPSIALSSCSKNSDEKVVISKPKSPVNPNVQNNQSGSAEQTKQVEPNKKDLDKNNSSESSKNSSSSSDDRPIISNDPYADVISSSENPDQKVDIKLKDYSSEGFRSTFGLNTDFLDSFPSKISVSLKPQFKDKYTIVESKTKRVPYLDSNGKDISQLEGKVKFEITLQDKENSNKEILTYGFLTGFVGLKNYAKASHEQQYNFENKFYTDATKGYLKSEKIWDGKNIDPKFRPDTNASTQDQENYNKKAEELKMDNWYNSYAKGHSVASYSNNQFQGIAIKEDKIVPKTGLNNAHLVNGGNIYRNKGVARLLLNETYKKIAEQSYSVQFTSKKVGNLTNTNSGTMWILDYVKEPNKAYPTKWLFATNVHVSSSLNSNTDFIRAYTVKKDTPLLEKLTHTDFLISDEAKKKSNFMQYTLNTRAMRKIYEATDFLKTSPKDFLTHSQKKKYADIEEFADFAVLEIDFEKIDKNFMGDFKNAYEMARSFTHNYAERQQDHVKFLKESYLKNYEKIDAPLEDSKQTNFNGDQLFALGFPTAENDFFASDDDGKNKNLTPQERYDRRQKLAEKFSLWINADPKYYDKFDDLKANTNKYPNHLRGNYLSRQLAFRQFKDKPGVFDAFLIAPFINDDGPHVHSDGKKYFSYGLNYLIKDYVPPGGSSGSSIRNQNNELVGIFHSGNQSANSGIAAAFRSEGFDYQGLYGKYKLAQYDLIFGGGKDQKTSYRQALAKAYENLGANLKTNIFANGISDDQVPSEFRFKN